MAAAVMAVPAGAASPELRGVVSGSPYGASGGYIAVPVLYSKMSARRVGLKSPVGLMVIKKSDRVRVNGAPSTLPVGLRVGDRFKGNAEVSDLNKRIFYPRITFEEPPQVYFRSKELSLSELTRLLQAVQKDLAALSGFTVGTFRLVAIQMAGLQKQIDDLKALIAGLPRVDLSGIQKQIDDLTKQVNDLIASLANYALKTDLAGFLRAADVNALIAAALAGLPGGLTADDVQALIDAALAGLPAGLTADDVQAMIDAALAGLDIPTPQEIQDLIDDTVAGLNIPSTADIQGLIDTSIAGVDVPTNAEIQALIDSTVTGLNLDQYATDATVNQLQSDLTAATDRINDLEGQVDQLCTALAVLPTVDLTAACGP